MDINQPISYKYPYRWDSEGMTGKPKANLLLKALIEGNLNEAQRLISAGASLQKIDKTTFEHSLFYLLENYNIVKFMTDNGLNHMFFPYIKCIDGGGYQWDLTGRAYILNKRNVLELLFSKGFEPGQFWKGDNTYDIDEYAMQTNHTVLIDIMLSHGYPKSRLLSTTRYSTEAYHYVKNVIVMNWKSYGLGDLDREICKPKPPKFGLLMTKRKQERYEMQKKSYLLELAARQNYINSLTDAERKAITKNKEIDEITTQAMLDMISENPEMFPSDTINIESNHRNSSLYNSSNNGSGAVGKRSMTYDSEMRDMEKNQFVFVDAGGSYRHWGDTFVDGAGNYVNWGSTFVDGAGNYVNWGSTFVDAGGTYRRWGDDFIDGAGNWVKCPRRK